MDPYAILGVDPRADIATIRRAYFSLMRRYHPDRVTGERHAQDESLARDLNLAFDLLKDPMKRAAYDRRRIGAGASTSRTPLAFKRPSAPPLSVRARRLRRVHRFHQALFVAGCLLVVGGAAGLASIMATHHAFTSAKAAPQEVRDRIQSVSAVDPATTDGSLRRVALR
jgi:curved DNA-binding protein CbpA